MTAPPSLSKKNTTTSSFVYQFNRKFSDANYDICLSRCPKSTPLRSLMNNKWNMYQFLCKTLGKRVTDDITPETVRLDGNPPIPFPFYVKCPLGARKEKVYYVENEVQLGPYLSTPGLIAQRAIVPDTLDGGKPYNLRLYVLVPRKGEYHMFDEGIIRISKCCDSKIVNECTLRRFTEHPEYSTVGPDVMRLMHPVMTSFSQYGENMFDRDAMLQLYGIDIVVDRQKRPWLIEINSGPAMAKDDMTEVRKQILAQAIDILKIPRGTPS